MTNSDIFLGMMNLMVIILVNDLTARVLVLLERLAIHYLDKSVDMVEYNYPLILKAQYPQDVFDDYSSFFSIIYL